MEGMSNMNWKSFLSRAAFTALVSAALFHATSVPARAQLATNSFWPMFQHDVRHTGQSTLNGPSKADGPTKAGVKIKWQKKFNAIVRTSPALSDDNTTIYIGVGSFPICALNFSDGEIDWCTNEPGYVVTPLMSSPAVDVDGVIYMGERGNDTWAVTSDGQTHARFSIPSDGDTLSSPAIDPVTGLIYTGCGCVGNGTLYALNPPVFPNFELTEAWHLRVGGGGTSSPAIGPDGTIYVISGPNRLHALTPGAQGATPKAWSPVNIGNNTKYGSPSIASDGTIYAPSMQGIRAIDKTDGHEIWFFQTQGGVNTTPGIAASDGSIHFGTTAGCFYSVLPNGAQKWKTCGLDGDFLSATAIGANGLAYSATTQGTVYAFNTNGSILWQTKIGKVQWSSPAIGPGNTLIIGSQDRHVYVLEEN
jgi:outer membrane protein assembly factor BamB